MTMLSRVRYVLIMCAAASAVSAALTITDEFGNAISSTYYDLTWDNGAATIEIQARYPDANGQNIWEVRGTAGEDIQLIDVQVASDDDVTTQIVLRVKSMTASGVGNLVEIRQTGDEVVLLNEVDITGYVGRVEVDTIGNLRADGTIYGPIISTGLHHGSHVNVVESRLEDVFADISSEGGIEYVLALNGDVGLDGQNRVSVVGGGVNMVQAQNIYADMTFSNDVKRIMASNGKFVGTLSAANVQWFDDGIIRGKTGIDADILLTGDLREPFVVLEGNFAAGRRLECNDIADQGRIEIGESANGALGRFVGDAFITGTVGAGSPVQIDNTLAGSIVIGDSLNAAVSIDGNVANGQGLTGQIIINGNNNGGSWSGQVVVGTTTLSGDGYTTPASDLGGGAVGLAPFRTHHESCVPVHGLEKEGAPASITLQFYGPVKPDDDTKMPVKVYRGPFGSDNWDAFTDVTASFDVEYPTDRKQVRVVPDIMQFKPRYRYRIVPIISSPGTGETLLLCDDLLTSSDVPVYGEDYWVDVEIAMTMLDLSENEWVDEPDLVLWAAGPEDFDGDGAADADDLLLITDNLGEPID